MFISLSDCGFADLHWPSAIEELHQAKYVQDGVSALMLFAWISVTQKGSRWGAWTPGLFQD
jgi:hypothetical protein